MSKGLNTAAIALTVGDAVAWVTAYFARRRLPAAPDPEPPAVMPVVLPPARDVDPDTVRVDQAAAPPGDVRLEMPPGVREGNARAHHIRPLGPAFPAPPPVQHALTHGWGLPPARPYAIADDLAAEIHDGAIPGYPSRRTGLTRAGVTWRAALDALGYNPDGPHEKLPDDGEAA